MARKGSAIRLVALLPQVSEFDEEGNQLKSPGFHMIILPFADDLRHLRFNKEEARKVAPNDLVDKAKAVISKLTLKGSFDPDLYDNPLLQRHYAMLQSLALDEDAPEEIEDTSMPNFERMNKRAGEAIEEFKQALNWKSDSEFQTETETRKSRAKKRQADHEVITGESMTESIRSCLQKTPDNLNQFMVADLKAYLESIGIKPKRVKTELITQILEHHSQQ